MIHATANISTTLPSNHSSAFAKWSFKEFIQGLVRPTFDRIEFKQPEQAHLICKLIPAQCPFERDIVLFGRKVLHIPAMCKLNPAYEPLLELRFRALSFLADECGEDITPYCH